MRIPIQLRLRPFSHRPGVEMLIPKTRDVATIYPTRVVCPDQVYTHPFSGPVENFVAFQDLERECIIISGHARQGYFRLWLGEEGLFYDRDQTALLEKKMMKKTLPVSKTPFLRLSLGCHKSPNWDFVQARFSLSEILPYFLRLSEVTPGKNASLSSLEPLEQALSEENMELFYSRFSDVLRARFHNLLVPHFFDPLFQGLPVVDDQQGEQFFLLKTMGQLLLRSFVDKDRILCGAPKQFPFGRLLHVRVDQGHMHLEWSKKMIRRMVFCAEQQGEKAFIFAEAKEFRCRWTKQGVVQKEQRVKVGTSLCFQEGEHLWLDRFTK